MQTEYKNGINCYILNDTVIEIDLQQDVLSINNIKSLLENDQVLRKVLN